MSQFWGKSDFSRLRTNHKKRIYKINTNLFEIYMSKTVGANIISNQSKLLKIKTKNCFGQFPKCQKCGAECWECGVKILKVFFQRPFNLTKQ